MKRATLLCCNADTDLLMLAAQSDDSEATQYEIRPGEEALRFVIEAIDEKLKRRFKGKGLGKKARGELAAIVFSQHSE